MLLGKLYGPADLYYGHDPWRQLAAEQGIGRPANPILSDLAFANLPWRAAVREALANGRFPFWNRFVLSGTPLLAAAQAGVFHPSTWLGIWLPVALSWTFSCTFTLFLSLLCAFLFFRDFRLSPLAAAVGAVGWGFSTYLVFWNGWSVGPATGCLPLLLLGLRRIASGGPCGRGLTVVGLLLSLAGGHPESLLHVAAAGSTYFLWELMGRDRRAAGLALRSALAAGLLAFLFAGPQLFPLLEAIPRSAEYRARKLALDSAPRQSVPAREASRRLLPAILPFAHGIYGRSPVQTERADGSGMPFAYAGAMLFPLGALSLLSRRFRERGRLFFVAVAAAGLCFGASAPGLLDLVTRLPGFALALNYRLVFLSALGLSGLAAFGAEEVRLGGSARRPLLVTAATLGILLAAFLLGAGVFRERALPEPFVRASFACEVGPLLLFAAGAAALSRRSGAAVAAAALVCLTAQRGIEMRGTYPTLPREALAPPLPGLETLPQDTPYRVAAAAEVFRPNAAALYGLEDVRGYESLVLDDYEATFPVWSAAQPASFNRIEDLDRPFLSFLNVRYAIAPPEGTAPAGWRERYRDRSMMVFENLRALPRAFAPRRIRYELDAATTLREMVRASDFSQRAWLSAAGGTVPEVANTPAAVSVRAIGPDLLISTRSLVPVFVATSVPVWPGWRARTGDATLPLVKTNGAFVGFWAPAGRRDVRLSFRPPSFFPGLAAFAAGLAALLGALLLANRRDG